MQLKWMMLFTVVFCGLSMMVTAVTPDVRLPNWNRISTHLTDWNPNTGQLKVEVRYTPLRIDSREVSVKISWPSGFGSSTPTATADKLPVDRVWKTQHTANGPRSFNGWLEVICSGRPERDAMLSEIAGIATLTPMMREIMRREAEGFVKPMPLGFSLPLYLDETIALPYPREMVITSAWPVASHSLFLWIPNAVMGTGHVALAYENFKKAVRRQDLTAALAELKALEAALEKAGTGKGAGAGVGTMTGAGSGGEETVALKSADNSEFQLKTPIILDALRFNHHSLAGITNPAAGAAALDDMQKTVQRGFIPGFLDANRGLLLLQAGKKAEARQAWQEALETIPAWPLLASRLKSL